VIEDAPKPFAEHTGRLLTVAQLAAALGVTRHTIYYWRELGLEPSFRVCTRGRCYFLITDVLTWLRRHRKVVHLAEWRNAA
jgi:DNA-binding transcriptional MerR regulator